MIIKIKNLVEGACRRETNPFGYGDWEYHILSVVANGKILAEKLGADMEIVELAALLHDYAGILNIDFYPEHHIHGARLAEEILEKYNYPKEKIAKIQHCILAHRGSIDIPQETIEAKIICSADAMAHFDNIHSLMYLAFVEYKMNIDKGTHFVLDKLRRSWGKISLPDARDIVKGKYEAAKKILE
ncbi:MAG: HD domain-containing protein [bacterium]